MHEQLGKAYRALPGRQMSGRHRKVSDNLKKSPVCQMEPLEGRQLLSTYYVSPSGSDSASGTSTSAPWKTISRVNNQKLHAGDTVLLKGGSSFSGGLYVPSSEGGTSSNPVVFSTYGSGRATINSGSKSGIDIAQPAGVSISKINFVGSKSGSTPGIYLHVDYSGKDVSFFHVSDVEVRNYGGEGILIRTSGAGGRLQSCHLPVQRELQQLHEDRDRRRRV